MEALKEFNIEELLKRQAMLDKKFDEKETLRKRSDTRLRIAYILSWENWNRNLRANGTTGRTTLKKLIKQK